MGKENITHLTQCEEGEGDISIMLRFLFVEYISM